MHRGTLTIYHCYFCGYDFGLSWRLATIAPCCPCCRNEDDVLLLTEIKYEGASAQEQIGSA